MNQSLANKLINSTPNYVWNYNVWDLKDSIALELFPSPSPIPPSRGNIMSDSSYAEGLIFPVYEKTSYFDLFRGDVIIKGWCLLSWPTTELVPAFVAIFKPPGFLFPALPDTSFLRLAPFVPELSFIRSDWEKLKLLLPSISVIILNCFNIWKTYG